MKKIFLLLAICLATSFAPEKKYHFEFSLQELQGIMYVIDQSNAPHATVKNVQEIISKQYQSQIDTTQKK